MNAQSATRWTRRDGADTAVDYDPFAGGALARVVPTTEPQREVWLADRLGREASLAYNESISLRLPRRARRRRAARRAAPAGRAPRRRCAPPSARMARRCASPSARDIALPIIDLSGAGRSRARRSASPRTRATWSRRRSTSSTAPLLRAELLRLAPDEHLLRAHRAPHRLRRLVVVGDRARAGRALRARRWAQRARSRCRPPSLRRLRAGRGRAAARARLRGRRSATGCSRFAGGGAGAGPADRPAASAAPHASPSSREDHVARRRARRRRAHASARASGASLFATLLAGFAGAAAAPDRRRTTW